MSTLFTHRSRTDFIAVHCAATPPTSNVGVKEIRQWHRAKGWIDIGYHFVIRRDGTVETGRPVDTVGAHVENWNSVSVGVCLVGGIDAKGNPQNNFTPAQFVALAELLIKLTKQYPKAEIKGHRDFPNVKKACPSFDVRRWIKDTGVFTHNEVEGDPDAAVVEVTNSAPTLYSIAKKYGTTVAALLKANPSVDPKALKLGQLIKLP